MCTSTSNRLRERSLPRLAMFAATWALLPLITMDLLPTANAWDPDTGRIEIRATLEPATLGPGQEGVFVAHFELPPKGKIQLEEGEELVWEPAEIKGVTFHRDRMTTTHHKTWYDEGLEENYHGWKQSFDVRIPVTIDTRVASGMLLIVDFTYLICDDKSCYQENTNKVSVAVGGKSGAATVGNGPQTDQPTPNGSVPTGDTSKSGAKAAASPGKLAPTISAPINDNSGSATLTISLEKGNSNKGVAVVTFEPAFGFHFYMRGDEGAPVTVAPKPSSGILWGDFEIPNTGKFHDAQSVEVPFTREDDATELALDVEWSPCDHQRCFGKVEGTLRASFAESVPASFTDTDVVPAPAGVLGDVAFEVIEAGQKVESGSKGPFGGRTGVFGLMGLLFLLGAGLAFTPCVFPIIPMVVATIGGGGDVPKGRLARLLGTYVLGLSLTFAVLGIVSALTGASMSAALESKTFQWAFSILFIVLSLGMLGVYELQPPEWAMKWNRGAEKRAGSYVGAFLFGVLGAILASPCTGPAIAGLLAYVAKTGNPALGFLLFFTLGLGMGAVFFAFGSMNFALRPGPWMVWVRYFFGALLFAGAIYYIAQGELLDHTVLLWAGIVIALLSGGLVVWHLMKKEFEKPNVSWFRGAAVTASYLVLLFGIWMWMRPPENTLDWQSVNNVEELKAAVAKANAEGRGVVVDFTAKNCTYCKYFKKVISKNEKLLRKFQKVTAIKVDLTDGEKPRLRGALAVPAQIRPVMVFIDSQGRIHRKADVLGDWPGWDKAREFLEERIDTVL